MPFSSGTFSVVYNWTTESGAPPIEIAKLDTQHADFATGLSNCLLRDGTGLPTAAIPFNSQNLTGVGQLEAARFVPTGSTVPSNGMYLPAANTVAWATNTTLRGSVNSTGNWTIAAPSSGAALTINQSAGSAGLVNVSASGNKSALTVTQTSVASWDLYVPASSSDFRLSNGVSDRITVASAGNVTITAPSSGVALTIGAVSGQAAIAAGSKFALGDDYVFLTGANLVALGNNSLGYGTTGTGSAMLFTNAAQRITVNSSGNVTINAPSSGVTLAQTLISGGWNATWTDGAATVAMQCNGANGGYIGTTTAHPFSIVTSGTVKAAITSAGNVTINAPSSGTALAVTTTAGGSGITFSDGTVTGYVADFGATRHNFGTSSNHSSNWYSNNTQRVVLAAAGNVTINAASSGDELTVVGSVVATSFAGALTGDVTGNVTGNASTATTLQTARTINGVSFNGSANITVTAAAETLTGSALPALSGASLTSLNASNLASGTVPSARITAVDAAATISSNLIGYRDVVRRTSAFARGECLAISAGVTLNTSDMAAGYTFSIYNDSASAITITQGAGVTLRLGGTTTTGNRTIAARGLATVWCNSGTEAIMTGSGVS